MGMSVGSRVRFLNEVGGGEIVKKLGGRTWLVRTEDGFEFPMSETDLVLDTSSELISLANKTAEQLQPKSQEREFEKSKESLAPKEKVQRNILRSRTGIEGLYLGFSPLDAHDILRGPYAMYVINESSYDLLLTLSRFERKSSITFFGGRVASQGFRKICEIEVNELFRFAFMQVQGIYYKLGANELREPFLLELAINASDFTRPRSFQENRFMDEELLLYTLRDEAKERELEVCVEKNIDDIVQEKAPKKIQPKGIPAPEQIEVDLHIEALIGEKDLHMSASEKLQYQLQNFREEMDNALAHRHVKRLVAIHGVGNGVLAKEVQRVLRMEYPRCAYQDASFKEYGYGATLVLLYREN